MINEMVVGEKKEKKLSNRYRKKEKEMNIKKRDNE